MVFSIGVLKRTCIFVLLAMLSSAMGSATDHDSFEGIYKGHMTLFEKKSTVPLAVSLVFTNEYVQIPTGNGVLEQQQVIDAAFVIDDEGGPYGFYKVSYNLDKSLIDLRYNRPTVTTTMVSIPSSFRLIGKVSETGEISGKVISGQDGPIGTFQISKNGVDQDILRPITKYVGKWAGTVKFIPGGQVFPFGFKIDGFGLANVNPVDLELDFTPGKVGSYSLRDVDLTISKIVVDYLRGKMYLLQTGPDGGNSVSIECDLSTFAQGEMTGVMSSLYHGKRGTFKVKRLPTP